MAAIGIDLGTTSSCVAVFLNGKVEIISNDQGNRTTPSYVAFTDTGILVGNAAKNQAEKNLNNTVYDILSLIDCKYVDSVVQNDKNHWTFDVVTDGKKPEVKVEYKGKKRTFFPEEIISMILTKMKETAESYFSMKIDYAVITVPAYFNDSQRLAIRDAATIAGLHVLRIISGSTAAAIAYDLKTKVKEDCVRDVLVFDIGGATVNVSVLRIECGIIEVKSTAGNIHLGGKDFDTRLANHFVEEFKRKHGRDLTSNKLALWRLNMACESAKKTLSSSSQASFSMDSLFEGINFNTSIYRGRFEELCSDLFQQTLEPVEKALRDAKIDKSAIHEIVLVGGSTHIPKIQQILMEFFNGKELNKSMISDEAGACGASIQAAIMSGDKSEEIKDMLLLDVAPFSLGIETAGGVMTTLIKRNTTIATKQQQTCMIHHGNQSPVLIKIYEGEKPMTKDNNLIGVLELTGISPVTEEDLQIDVCFDLDFDGILKVSASEKGTGYKKSFTVTNHIGRLSRREIENIIYEAKMEKNPSIQKKLNFEFDNCIPTGKLLGKLYDELMSGASGEIPTLRVSFKKNINKLLHKISFIVKKCRTTSLSLEYDNMDDESIELLQKLFTADWVKHLEILNISYNSDITEAGFQRLGLTMKEFNIQSLKATDCDITDEKLKHLLLGLRSCKMKRLDIGCNENLTIEGFETLADFVGKYGIDCLKISGCNVAKEDIRTFCKIEPSAENKRPIQELDVSYNATITSDTMLGLVVGKCGITRISLAGCKLSEDHLAILGNFMRGHKLNLVNLRDNASIGDGIVEIAKMVRECQIDELNICDCMFSAQELQSFSDALNGAKLSRLHLGDQGREPDSDYIDKICDLMMAVKDTFHLRFRKLNDTLLNRLRDLDRSSARIILIVGREEKEILRN